MVCDLLGNIPWNLYEPYSCSQCVVISSQTMQRLLNFLLLCQFMAFNVILCGRMTWNNWILLGYFRGKLDEGKVETRSKQGSLLTKCVVCCAHVVLKAAPWVGGGRAVWAAPVWRRLWLLRPAPPGLLQLHLELAGASHQILLQNLAKSKCEVFGWILYFILEDIRIFGL